MISEHWEQADAMWDPFPWLGTHISSIRPCGNIDCCGQMMPLGLWPSRCSAHLSACCLCHTARNKMSSDESREDDSILSKQAIWNIALNILWWGKEGKCLEVSSRDLACVAADLIFNMSLTLETLTMKDKGSCKALWCPRSRLCLRKVQGGFLPSDLLPSAESENVCFPLIVMSTNIEI